MDDAVFKGDIRGRNLGPFLRLQLGQQLVTDCAVISLGDAGRPIDRHRQGSYKVSPAHNPHELAIAQDRHPLDSVGFEQNGNIGNCGLLDDRDDAAR